MLQKMIFLTVLTFCSNLLAQLQPIEVSFVKSKGFVSVFNNTWKLARRGLMSCPITLEAADTVVYTIVRERQRNISFCIEGAKARLLDTVVQGNMLTAAFIVQKAGTYLFKINNRSFLGNTIFFEVKKNSPLPAVVSSTTGDSQKSTSNATPKPLLVSRDTLYAVYDSVHYVACSFNLKQPSSILLPLDSTDVYQYFVTQSSNIAIVSAKGQSIALKACYKITQSTELAQDRARLCIYAVPKTNSTKLIGKHDCLVKLPVGAMAQNEDKVVGKSLHLTIVKLKSILKPTTP